MKLKNKVVIVTGASQGIGRTLAVALARQGARVVCAARNAKRLDKAVAEVEAAGGEGLAVETDITQRADVDRLIERTVARFGGLDALVNNAGLSARFTSLMSPIAEVELEMAVNFYGTLHGMQAALPFLKASKGAILNVSSSIALNPQAGLMMFGASKLAMERLTLDAARELVPDGVACNALRIDVTVMHPKFDPSRLQELDLNPETAARIAAVKDSWEPLEFASDAMIWMLRQEPDYTGHLEGLRDLAVRGLVRSRAKTLFPLSAWERWSW